MVPEGSGGSDQYQIHRQIMLNVQRCVTIALMAVKELYLAISGRVVLLAFCPFLRYAAAAPRIGAFLFYTASDRRDVDVGR